MTLRRDAKAERRAVLRGILPAWFALLLLIGGIGVYVHGLAEDLLRQNIHNDLRAIAQLQAGQIRHWLSEREDEAAMLANPHFLGSLRDWLAGGENASHFLPHLADQMTPGVNLHQSRRYRLRSAEDGHLLLTPEPSVSLQQDRPEARRLAMAAARQGTAVFDDLHFIGDDPALPASFGLFVPLRAPDEGKVLAVLQIGVSPEDFLYPLLRSWPTASASGEMLLVRKEGDEALYLNPLRRHAGPPMSLRRSMTKAPGLLASRVAGEGSGTYEGVDYQGVPCLAYGLAIEGTPWLLLAKIDEAEAWRPFRLMTGFSVVLLGFTLLLIGLWMYGRQRDRIRLQQALDEAEDLYQNAPCGYHSLDEAGRILRINDTGLRLLGYEREELLGRPVTMLMTPERRIGFEQRFRNMVENLFQSEQLELDLLCKSGETLPVRVSSTALRDASGKFLASRTLVFDLREQRRLEAEQRLLQQSIEASFDGFVVFAPGPDHQWRFTYCNPAFERLTGYTRSEILGRTPDFLHDREPDQPELFRLFDAITAGERYQGVLRNFRKDGRPYWVQLLLDPVRDEQDRITHYVGIQRDVTTAREAEEKLQASHEQLRQLSQWHS